jgi:hypothetical protein
MQVKKYYMNEAGLKCFTCDCGCEGVFLPEFGWKTCLCDECLEEQNTYCIPRNHGVLKFDERYAV